MMTGGILSKARETNVMEEVEVRSTTRNVVPLKIDNTPLPQSFKTYISFTYGVSVLKTMNKYRRTKLMLVRQVNHCTFLKSCIEHKIIPKCFNFKLPFKLSHTGINLKFQLSLELIHTTLREQTKSKLNLIRSKKCLRNSLQLTLSNNDFSEMEYLTDKDRDAENLKVKIRHEKKLVSLGVKMTTPKSTPTTDSSKRVVNLSSVTLNENETSILSKGLSHAYPTNKCQKKEIITAISKFSPCLPEEKKTKYELETALAITSHHETVKPNRTVHKLKNQLKSNGVISLKADKGGAVVLMNETDYINKMKDHLKDEQVYKIIPKDITDTIQGNVKSIINTMVSNNELTQAHGNSLIQRDSKAPRAYGQIKIHKPNKPVRIIVNVQNSPTHRLSKFVTRNIRKYNDHLEHAVKNSYEFIEELNKVELTGNEQLVSFDVTSMYTNIPVKKALDCGNTFLIEFPEILDGTKMSLSSIMTIMDLCTSNTYFSFQNKFYEQVQGVPMGQPLSVPIANIYMHYFENTLLQKCPLKPKLYKRYLDDSSIVWEHGDEALEAFLNLTNNHGELTFTMEKEVNQELPFLDILMKRQGSSIGRDVYRKETNSGIILNANSNHPKSMKLGILKSLTLRSLRLSDVNHREVELGRLRESFKANGYKETTINRIFDITIQNFSKPEGYTPTEKPDKNTKFLMLPDCKLATKIKEIGKDYGITTRLKQTCTLASILPNQMEKVNPLETSGVYKVPCAECPFSYYGESMRPIRVRLGEHKSAVKYNHTEKSDLSKHNVATGHTIAWDSAKRIALCNRNNTTRKLREAVEIKLELDVMNSSSVEKSLGPIFNTTLKYIKSRKRKFGDEIPNAKRRRLM